MFANAPRRNRLADAIFGGIIGFGVGCIIYELNIISLNHEVEHLLERLPELSSETADKLATIITEDNSYSYEKWGTAFGAILGGCFGVNHNWISPSGFFYTSLMIMWLSTGQHTKCEIQHENVTAMSTIGMIIMIGALYVYRTF